MFKFSINIIDIFDMLLCYHQFIIYFASIYYIDLDRS